MLWKFLKNHSRQENRNQLPRINWNNLGFLVATFWILRVALWLKNPGDKTGNLSPTPFGPAGPFFSDIFQVVQAGRFNQAYDYSTTSYPPFITAISRLLNFEPDGLKVFSIAVLTIIVWSYLINFLRSFSKEKSLPPTLILILALPILFAVARGNLDLLAIGLIGLGIVLIQQNKIAFALAAFTFASALKYWPILVLLFLINKIGKKYFFMIALFSGILTIFSGLICGYHGLRSLAHVVFFPITTYSNSSVTSQLPYSYSIFFITFLIGIFRYSKNFMHPSHDEIDAALRLLSPFEGRVFVLTIIIGLLVLNVRMKFQSSNLLIGSGAALLLTGTSYTYRGCILVLVLLIRVAFENEYFRFAFKRTGKVTFRSFNWLGGIELFLWAILLLPIDFIYARNSLISITSLAQPISLIWLITLEILYFRLPLFSSFQKTMNKQREIQG